MIVTFCGHSDFQKTRDDEEKMIALLEEKIGYHSAKLYLGGYGAFDFFAYECGKKYQKTHPNISLVFVTPYLTIEYQKKHLVEKQKMYDAILYPPIEDKPLRFAISYRNRYMMEKADIIIAYVTRSRGGAYQSYRYAKRKGKTVFNLALSKNL